MRPNGHGTPRFVYSRTYSPWSGEIRRLLSTYACTPIAYSVPELNKALLITIQERGVSVVGLSETDPFDGLPCTEQPIERGLISDESDNNAASPTNNPTGDEYDAM